MKCKCCTSDNGARAIVKTTDGKIIACGFLHLDKNHKKGSFVPIGRLLSMAAFPEVAVEVAEKDASNKFSAHIHKLRNWRFEPVSEKKEAMAEEGDKYQFDEDIAA